MKGNIVVTLITALLMSALAVMLILEHERMSDTTVSVLGFCLVSSFSLYIISLTNKTDNHEKS